MTGPERVVLDCLAAALVLTGVVGLLGRRLASRGPVWAWPGARTYLQVVALACFGCGMFALYLAMRVVYWGVVADAFAGLSPLLLVLAAALFAAGWMVAAQAGRTR